MNQPPKRSSSRPLTSHRSIARRFINHGELVTVRHKLTLRQRTPDPPFGEAGQHVRMTERAAPYRGCSRGRPLRTDGSAVGDLCQPSLPLCWAVLVPSGLPLLLGDRTATANHPFCRIYPDIASEYHIPLRRGSFGATRQAVASSSRMAGWRCCIKPMMALSMTFAALVAI